MAHYAKVLNGVVEQVIVAEAEFFDTFVDTSPGDWIQTSYNTNGNQHPEGSPLRYNFASVGGTYDADIDAFINYKPANSWTLDETTCQWQAPTPFPADGADGTFYTWDEETTNWLEVTV